MKITPALFILTLLLVLNAVVFIQREKFRYIKQVAYNELYPVITDVPVREIIKQNDSVLRFQLLSPPKHPVSWYCYAEGKRDSFQAIHPYITANKGLHSYRLFSPSYRDTIFARIEYLPATGSAAPSLALYRENIGQKNVTEMEDWQPVSDPVSPAEQKEVNAILSDSIGVTAGMTTEQKTALISIYLHKTIFASSGTPDAATLQLNPARAYKAASAGKEIWCGIYARIFNLFARSANIKSRTVEMLAIYKNVSGPVHEFNEYFDKEKRQWVATDIMFNNTRYYNSAGKLLTGIEVKNTDRSDSSVKILQAAGDNFIYRSFSGMEPLFYDLYGREKDLRYYKTSADEYNGPFIKRLKNHILPEYWYELYSDIRIWDNRNFYIKQLLLGMLLIFAVYTGARFALKSYKSKNDRI